ncbi:unnamed protein product [Hymenolepis diminuta]|uniref:Selenoprotein T n=1 Tax=Hymenolepis diminuta TaxID=6216 RepID=A0A158QG50_HYMDI|nr:unnamed protein product [Hymenolepis diminuta]
MSNNTWRIEIPKRVCHHAETPAARHDGRPTKKCFAWYRRAYEELAHIVIQRYPAINIEGLTYPPPQWRAFVAQLVTAMKFLTLALVIAGINPFPFFGLETPNFVTYANENKVSVCLMCFFVGGLIESQLLSTGAFEVTFNDIPIWSKLQSNRFPSPQELLSIIGSHMEFQAPGSASAGMSFNPNNHPPPKS